MCVWLISLRILPSWCHECRVSYFLWLDDIPLCMRHIFFIQSPISGRWGWLHILATVNNNAETIGAQISFWVCVFVFFRDPWVEQLGRMVVPFLTFWGISVLFGITAAPVYIPTNRVPPPLSSARLPACALCGLSDDSHPDVCEVLPPCGSRLPFPGSHWFEHLFMHLLAIPVFSLKNICSAPLLIFSSSCLVFLVVDVYEILIYFGF